MTEHPLLLSQAPVGALGPGGANLPVLEEAGRLPRAPWAASIAGLLGLKSGVLPRWFGRVGYLVGAVLLVFVAVWDWVILVLPIWVALISLSILRRERARRRTA